MGRPRVFVNIRGKIGEDSFALRVQGFFFLVFSAMLLVLGLRKQSASLSGFVLTNLAYLTHSSVEAICKLGSQRCDRKNHKK